MKNPFFSVIIPTYNRANLILKTVDSFLNQSYENFELIVVDDGSTDNTEQVLSAIKDKRFRYFKKVNAERGAARNFGASKARGKYFNFFDSDDFALKSHLELAYTQILELDQPEIIYLTYNVVDVDGNLISQKFYDKSPNEEIIHGNPVSTNGMFLRSDIAREFQFNEDRALATSEDWELWMRLSARYKINYSNKVSHSVLEHEERSIYSFNDIEKLSKRKALMIKYMFEDPEVNRVYSKYKRKMELDSYSYVAIHAVMSKEISLNHAVNYFLKYILTKPSNLFTRKAAAIMRRISIRIITFQF